jgi:5'-nucleotidase (lipoprotein e(P4) family)
MKSGFALPAVAIAGVIALIATGSRPQTAAGAEPTPVTPAAEEAPSSSPPALPGAHEQLDSALWVHTSAEFYAIARQTFASATEKLDLAMRDPTWTASTEQFATGDYQQLPPAVIVNLDEAVWSNSPYQNRIILQYGQHDMNHFIAWCNEAKCTAIPGAKEFLDHAARQGVSIVYITARPALLQDATKRNLSRLKYPLDDQKDSLIMDGGWPNHDKRELIAKGYRITLIISDSLGDFMHDTEKDAVTRREMAAHYADNWGLKWFLIPNPMYGHWEYSFHKYDYNLDRPTRIRNKLKVLDPGEDQSPSNKGQ